MRWDRISYSKVAQRIRRTWALQSQVFKQILFLILALGDGMK